MKTTVKMYGYASLDADRGSSYIALFSSKQTRDSNLKGTKGFRPFTASLSIDLQSLFEEPHFAAIEDNATP